MLQRRASRTLNMGHPRVLRLVMDSLRYWVTAHDGFTLRDLVPFERKYNVANLEDNRYGTDNDRSWNCGVFVLRKVPGR